jgi:hypothetical protein
MIVAASTALLADSRSGGRGGLLPWALLVTGSVASLAANVAVAEPTAIGRVIAAWPSFALIGAYEMLMHQIRRIATGSANVQTKPRPQISPHESAEITVRRPGARSSGLRSGGERANAHPGRGRDLQWQRGSGRWLTGRQTAHFLADARLLGNTPGTSAGPPSQALGRCRRTRTQRRAYRAGPALGRGRLLIRPQVNSH